MRLALWGCFVSTCLVAAVAPGSSPEAILSAPPGRAAANDGRGEAKPADAAERISDKIAALPADDEYYSLELVPPQSETSLAKLRQRIDSAKQDGRLLFVSVTWRIGNTTPEQSLEFAELCQRELGVTALLHMSGTNMSTQEMDRTLEDVRARGIRNIFAVRGNRLPGAENSAVPQAFPWAVDLVRHIREKHGDYFCIGVAAYPEGHFNASDARSQSLEHDLPFLAKKVEAGADFVISQLFFNGSAYDSFETRLREYSNAFATIPILPGILPIQSKSSVEFGARLAHATVPDDLISRLDKFEGNKDKVRDEGANAVSELVQQVRATQCRHGGPRGYHFFNANEGKSVSLILDKSNIVPGPGRCSNQGALFGCRSTDSAAT
ncbi:methylenetetrahydrofolate reductase [Hirsutella rhossiliensis]|uniref:Methylenetetrahydrofolate reductase domain-containing protein n=1 Tax=Hirsutella rhossiliensis TaxID=111463 RepID=A0A9P8SHI2_9HYPO|nr:methylenetetrahydrofolate reductase domain-containing protein [Hirsutella rhossiliensis]KAH0961056.1 methylenetetrahydrofolate reductase domain-containing protein [Hirsutella rhossiliensis]